MSELPNYDTWKTTPPEGVEPRTCRECGEEGYPDQACPGCGERIPSYCGNGRCGACDGCEEAIDRAVDLEPGKVTFISDPDGDVDEEGRSFGIPPRVYVLWPEAEDPEDTENFIAHSSARGPGDDDAPWICDDLRVIRPEETDR